MGRHEIIKRFRKRIPEFKLSTSTWSVPIFPAGANASANLGRFAFQPDVALTIGTGHYTLSVAGAADEKNPDLTVQNSSGALSQLVGEWENLTA